MVPGSGVSNLNELMGTMNCPGMSQNTFSTIEEEIGETWQDCVYMRESKKMFPRGKQVQKLECANHVCKCL
ncbi:hypothetical protein KUTeg_003872 [Tegillarca granosa]|uniref:Uncharacterized protein n=1 Tax=Tegillarca granosa TaxID=220873 RepID=A0ABQ9FQ00_TEGGR|nr:hypothetical protein KUTeg_003872 [Tegillarca granosa]